MKIHEIITESSVDTTLDGILTTLKSDCNLFLKQARSPVWRGIDDLDQPKLLTKISTVQSRSPRDTPQIIHKEVVAWFAKHTDINFREKYAVFGTGYKRQALAYGELYAMFPIGKFHFCWSPNYQDLFTAYEDECVDFDMNVSTFLQRGEYIVDRRLQDAIESNNEIIFQCKQYYAINMILLKEQASDDEIDAFFERLFGAHGGGNELSPNVGQSYIPIAIVVSGGNPDDRQTVNILQPKNAVKFVANGASYVFKTSKYKRFKFPKNVDFVSTKADTFFFQTKNDAANFVCLAALQLSSQTASIERFAITDDCEKIPVK